MSASPESGLIQPRSVDRPILFGTSGWRGPLGEEVTFPRLRVLVRSVCDWIHEQDRGERVLVGWDTRFASRQMADTTAGILVEAGLEPLVSEVAIPTPAITYALSARAARAGCAAGLMLTASHNPACDHGIKVFDSAGATIVDADARWIEAVASARFQDDGPERGAAPTDREDFRSLYREALASLLDPDAMRRSGIEVMFDAMHGSAAGILDRVLEEAGARVRRVRARADPNFGGGAPDPIPENLTRLTRETRQIAALGLGLATDGDGDRFGVIDTTGRVLTETQVLALLIDHLAQSGHLHLGVAITVGTGSLVERVAADHGLRVERHPVGFKYLSAAMAEQRADVAGEESGGFALATMGLGKDGLLAGCLLANLVATSGESLEAHVERLEAKFGAHACGRTALRASNALDQALAHLESAPPQRLGEVRVSEVDGQRGLRLGLEDGGFLILRRSGTEPMLRIYAEAESREALEIRLVHGIQLLEETAKAFSSDPRSDPAGPTSMNVVGSRVRKPLP